MSKHFDAAVDWLEQQLSPLAEAGFLVAGREPFLVTKDELMVRAEIGYWHFGNNSIPNVMSEAQAARLWELCEKRRGAFDMSRHAAATYIHQGWKLPEGLRIFATLYLGGQLSEPEVERVDRTFGRKFFLYSHCLYAHWIFKLELTSGDGTSVKVSACDAVSAAAERCGVHFSTRTVKDICVGSHANEREFRRWFHNDFCELVGEFWSENSQIFGSVASRWKIENSPVMRMDEK